MFDYKSNFRTVGLRNPYLTPLKLWLLTLIFAQKCFSFFCMPCYSLSPRRRHDWLETWVHVNCGQTSFQSFAKWHSNKSTPSKWPSILTPWTFKNKTHPGCLLGNIGRNHWFSVKSYAGWRCDPDDRSHNTDTLFPAHYWLFNTLKLVLMVFIFSLSEVNEGSFLRVTDLCE